MARFYPTGGGAPGVNPSALTATAGDVVAGAIAGVKDNYDPVIGTLTLTGNAQTNHVLSGETFYTTNPKSKITGTMTVQSILSFSSAPYSANQIVFSWQNPSSGPFSGVIIIGKTGGYPTSISDGTRYYKGYGNNVISNGTSTVVIEGFVINTTYYFRAFSYATINNEEWLGSITRIASVIIQRIRMVFTSSTTWSIPSGVNFIDIFCVGGGGGGSYGFSGYGNYGGGGGGGGNTSTTNNVSVSPNQNLNIIIGNGGNGVSSSGETGNGGTTYVSRSGTIIASANGGNGGSNGSSGYGGNGGSGGGSGAYNFSPAERGGNGGSNGSDGETLPLYSHQGIGQHYTTTEFLEGSGTVFSGGGGGGGNIRNGNPIGYGGNYGGGNGGDPYSVGGSATVNSGGGGGGGGGGLTSGGQSGGNGGSGICIIRYVG